MDRKSGVPLLAARLGLAALFVTSAFGKIASWDGTVSYAAAKGVPEILLAGAVALQIVGGASVLAGWRTRWGVAALLTFLAPATVLFHGFWGYQGAEAQLQTIQFLKNVSIAGGLLALGAAGPGSISVDARAARARVENAPAPLRAAA